MTERPLGVDRAAFSCGVEPLDEYFTGENIQRDVESGVTTAYVYHDDASNRIVGYYTLSNFVVLRANLSGSLSKKMRYQAVPATLIGRLAIQHDLRKQGIGRALLMRALIKAHALSQQSASRVVVVDTISDDARRWYVKNGFAKLNNEDEQFFFDLRRVPALVEAAGTPLS